MPDALMALWAGPLATSPLEAVAVLLSLVYVVLAVVAAAGAGSRAAWFAHLRLAVCTRAIADAVAAAGLVSRYRRLWLPALVARGYDADLAAVVAWPRRSHRRVAGAGCGHRAFPGRGNAGSLAPRGCVDHGAEPLRRLAHGPW